MNFNPYVMFLLMGSSMAYNVVLLYILMKIRTNSIVFLAEPNGLILGLEILFLLLTLLFWVYFCFVLFKKLVLRLFKNFLKVSWLFDMPNGDYNSNDIYYKLGEVHSDIKSMKDEIEDIRDMQINQGDELKKTQKKLGQHLIESDIKKKQKKEQKQQGYANIGILIAGASILINVIIEAVKFGLDQVFK